MAESYSVKAVLSAVDKGFSAAMKDADSSASSLGSTIKSGLGFGVMVAAGTAAFNSIKSGISGVISELSTSSAAWQTFASNMGMIGLGSDEIADVQDDLQDFATQTIYSASDMATTYSQLAAVGTKNTDELVKGFGGLAAAAANPTQAMTTLSQQATQMAAKPTVAWADYKLMLEQTPAGMAAVAKQMGMTSAELVAGVQAGTVSTEDFFDAISKVGTNDAFTELATSYKTADQAMDGLEETLVTKLMPAFTVLQDGAITAIEAITDKIGDINMDAVVTAIQGAAETIQPYWDVLKTAATEVGESLGGALSAIGASIGNMASSFANNEDSITSFSDVVGKVTGVLTSFFDYIADHADTITFLAGAFIRVAIAIKAASIISSVATGVSAFVAALSGVAAVAPVAAPALTAVGTASAVSAPQILAAGAALLMLGGGIALAAIGIVQLATAAATLAAAGPAAIAVMLVLIAVIAGLAIGASILGPALTVGAVGFLAFGAALLMVGVGALLASIGIALIAASLPTVAQYGLMGAAAIAALAVSIMLLGVSGLTAVVGLTALSVVLVVTTAAMALFAIAVGASAAGAALLAAGLLTVDGLMQSIANKASEAASSLEGMVTTIDVVSAALDGLGELGKSAVDAVIGAFSDAAGDAQSAGEAVGNGLTTGVTNGLKTIQNVAMAAITAFAAVARSGYNSAYSAGSYIGQGLANGMSSMLSTVTAAATALAAQADIAIRAEAQINSPSKVATEDGAYWGLGIAKGMVSTVPKIKAAGAELYNAMGGKNGSNYNASYSGSLNDDYSYQSSGQYTISVPLNVDGKRFAQATASYITTEQSKNTKLNNYFEGVR